MAHRRDLLKLAGLPAFAALAGGAGPQLPNTIVGSDEARLTREAFGDLRIYFEGATPQVKSMTAGSLLLKPGMTPHPPHQHPEEEFMAITEGSGEITLDGKVTRVLPGSM